MYNHSFLMSSSPSLNFSLLLVRNIPMTLHNIQTVSLPSFTQTKDEGRWILVAHLDFFIAVIVLKVTVNSKKISLVCSPSKHVLKIFSCNCLAGFFYMLHIAQVFLRSYFVNNVLVWTGAHYLNSDQRWQICSASKQLMSIQHRLYFMGLYGWKRWLSALK